MSDDEPATAGHAASINIRDGAAAYLSGLDDSTLIAWRRKVREQLEREPGTMADLVRAHYLLTREVVRRTITLRRNGSG
jgi:hypothetical protein